LPPGVFEKEEVYAKRRWKQVQYLSNLFWKRWVREYIPLLQERQKWLDVRRNLEVGDVVLVVDEKAPRNSWSLGRIQDVMPDRNGLVRQAKVKTQNNVLTRPVDKLVLILENEERLI
jgi:putative ribosome biogenesis GTPase RsgA